MSTWQWVGGSFVLLVLLFKVGLPLVTFFASLVDAEKSQLLRPMEAHEIKAWSPMLERAQSRAEGLGFVFLGHYTEGGRGQIGILISGDARTALMLLHWGISNYEFFTPLPEGRMLRTRHTAGLQDHSGLDVRQMLPSKRFEVVHHHHERRVEACGDDAGYFDPERVAEELVEHEARRMRRLIELGLARARDEKTYTCTWKGAFKNAVNYAQLGGQAEKAGQLVQKAEKWYDAQQKHGAGSVVGGTDGAEFDA